MSNLWIIRPGEGSKDQQFALENSCAVIGWSELGDLRDYDTLDKVRERVRKKRLCTNPDSTQSVNSAAGQVWCFANRAKKGDKMDGVKKGDLIILPLKGGVRNNHSAIGEVVGSYRFRKKASPGCRHQRPLTWLNREFPNAEADILRIVRRPTVNKVGGSKECADLRRALKGGGQSLGSSASAQDIKRAIGLKFPAKQMEELVRQILNAMGYECEKPKSKGADGGLDAFATHPDKNGLVDPICAQVKNTTGAVGAPEMQKLAGAMSEACMRKGCMGPFYKGLFISYGGFGGTAKKKELAQRFPRIRQWDADDILRLAREYCGKIKCANCKKRLAECGISAAGSVQ